MAAQFDPAQFDTGDEKTKFSDLFVFQKVLGTGSFGIVVSARQKPFLRECAVKIIQKKSLRAKNLESFWKESQILQQMDHPNIVKFIAINETETRIFLVMELVRGGQLQSLIQERKKMDKPLTDEEASTIMRSIFSGLSYIHQKDIVHRDLKPENILLDNKDDLTSVKICDFGLSAQYNDDTCTRSFNEKCGTDIFMAPELWKKKRYSKPVDMFSCGIIMYMLLSGGKHPFYVQGEQREVYLKKLEAAQWPMLPNFNKYSKDMFLKLVHEEPCERYTSQQVKNHPWMTRRFNENIPLTSSEKIAAFSHSQILSRLIKSLYFVYAVENEDTYKDPVQPKKHPEQETTRSHAENHEEALLGLDKPRINVFKPHNGSDMAVFGMAQDTLKVETKLKYAFTPLPGTESSTPTLGEFTRKTAPTQSNQNSNTKSSSGYLRPRRDKDITGLGSLNDLETTLGSNAGSQQEDKITKNLLPSCGEIPMQTEPSRTPDLIKPEKTAGTISVLGRAACASVTVTTFVRRRSSNSNKIPDKILNGHYQDSGVDVSHEMKAVRSAKPGSRHFRQKGIVSITNVTTNMDSINNIDTSIQAEVGKKGTGLQKMRRIINGGEDIRSMGELQEEHLRFGSVERKTDEIKGIKKRERKGTAGTAIANAAAELAALQNLEKGKLRQYSLPNKKKLKKEKSFGKVQKMLNMTGGGRSQPYGLGVNGISYRGSNIENKLDMVGQKVEERKGEAHHEEKKGPSLLRAFKGPIKEGEDVASLPQIKSEMRKTKMSFVNNSEKGLVQKNMGAFGHVASAINKTSSRMTKPATPFKQ